MTERQLHVGAWITVAVLLVVGWRLAVRAGVEQEQSRHLADSLRIAGSAIAHADTALHAARDSAALREAQTRAERAHQAVALRGSQNRLDSLQRRLDSLSAPIAVKALINSLQATWGAQTAILQARGDSAWARFTVAASQRDSALSLLRASEAQIGGLQVALVKARHVPLWNTPAVKVVQLALALKGVASLVGH